MILTNSTGNGANEFSKLLKNGLSILGKTILRELWLFENCFPCIFTCTVTCGIGAYQNPDNKKILTVNVRENQTKWKPGHTLRLTVGVHF